FPAPDADVDVVALRKDPGVAARDHAQLEDEPAPVARVQGSVSLQRDAVSVVTGERERARRRAVDPVRADDHVRVDALAVHDDAAVVERGRDAVPELRARLRGLPREEVVEAPTLSHEAEGRLARPLERRAVVEPKLEAVDDVLHDRIDG